VLVTLEKAQELINSGKLLMIAGDQTLLSKLPTGLWIGGSIPYFIAENGGVFSKDKVFVTELDKKQFSHPAATSYTETTISQIAKMADDDSLTFLILPFASTVHHVYSKQAPDFPGMFSKPIVGWISGIALDEIGKVQPSVMNGFTGEIFTDRAVALRCNTPQGKPARIGIVNIFHQGAGDTIEFLDESFDVKDAMVNGKQVNFSKYLEDNKIDTQLPLVANFSGAKINVSVMANDAAKGIVHLYAPVFKNVAYKIAAPLGDYPKAFEVALKELEKKSVVFSCNCILNYLYGGLEGKKTGSATGPVTFGEIAYQLVNQTFVYVEF